MKDLLLSRLETYLLDEERLTAHQNEHLEAAQQEERTEYPQGFFSGL